VKYLPHVVAIVAILCAILFAVLWIGERNLLGRDLLDSVRVDVMGVVSGATCDYSDESDVLRLAVLYVAPSETTFVWQMTVPGEGVVWEQTETATGDFFYTATGRGTSFAVLPDVYSAQPNTLIRIEATAYRGQNTSGRPADFSMIEFDCTTGAVVNSTFTEEIAE